MTVSHALLRAPPRCPRSPFSWCFSGILLMALVLLLPICSDACGDPPRFQSMTLKGLSKTLYLPGDRLEFKCHLGYKRVLPFHSITALCRPDNTWTPLQEACTGKTCPQLEDPLNGEVVYVNGSYQFGSQAHYICRDGYYIIGTKIRYCELSGNNVEWSDSPPQCEKILCQPPAEILNGNYTNSHKNMYEYNEVVTYSCDLSDGPDEYSLVGESRLICSGQNVWNHDPPQCKVVKCPYPVVKNGKMTSGFGKKFYYQAKVTFECLEGFHLEGSSTIVCEADSTWDPKVPKCTKGPDACGEPPTFESMMLNGLPKTFYLPGARVEFQCRAGFKRVVPFLSMTVVCRPDSTWTPLQEACARKSCQQLGEPLNGDVVYINGSHQFGSQAHYVCNKGFYIIGPQILHCELSGNNVEWSDIPPRCEKMLCQPPKKILNGKYTNSQKDTFEYNEVVTYRCDPPNGPDEYSLVGESRLVCSGQNVWSHDPPECKVVKCPYPVVKNGRMVSGFGKKFYYQAKVTFECLEGFYLEGSSTIVCEADSSWDPNMPRCIKNACGDPSRYQTMKLKGLPKSLYQPGDTVEYECRLGYIRIVPPVSISATCQADNTWTPLQEACKKKPCPQLAELLNGNVVYQDGTYTFGSQAHYSCNEGYYLIGAKTIYCELSGNGNAVAWSNEAPVCEKVLCQPPRQIANGKYTNSQKDTFEYNEVVIYSCNPPNGSDDYSLIGESRLICSGRNVWSSEPPECKVVKCPYPTLANGRIVTGVAKKFYYQAMVTFECLSGFHLEGNSTISCGADSIWTPSVPRCIKASTTLSTKATISSASDASPTVSITSPTSSQSGSVTFYPTYTVKTSQDARPTISVTSSTSSHSGHSIPSVGSSAYDDDGLDGGLIAVIVLTFLWSGNYINQFRNT